MICDVPSFVVKVEEIVAMNHFKSVRQEDQYTLSRETLPTALQASCKCSYSLCLSPGVDFCQFILVVSLVDLFRKCTSAVSGPQLSVSSLSTVRTRRTG